jgi:ABC-2 type transport system ATP-binding protein
LTGLGKTVLLTTHYLDEAESLADRAAVIVGGCIVAEGTPRDIGGRSQADAVVTFARRAGLDGLALPPVITGHVAADDGTGLVRIETDEPTGVIEQLAVWAATAGVRELPELTVTRPTLEDTYLRLIAMQEAVAE